MTSCEILPAKRFNVALPDSLQYLVGVVPAIADLPYYETMANANIALIHRVKKQITMNRKIIESHQLAEIAKPIATEMQMLKPTLVIKLNTYVPITVSLSLTFIVFVGNVVLHILAIWAYHRFALIRRYLPAFLNSYIGHTTGPELQAPHQPKSEPLEQESTSERGQPFSATMAKQVVDTSKAAMPVQGKIAENAENKHFFQQ